MFKKAVQRGRSERRGEAYFEPLSDARTKPGERRVLARLGGRVKYMAFSTSCQLLALPLSK